MIKIIESIFGWCNTLLLKIGFNPSIASYVSIAINTALLCALAYSIYIIFRMILVTAMIFIARKTKTGEQITEGDLKVIDDFKGGKKVENPADALARKSVGNFEVSYTQQESIEQLIKDGRVTQPENVSFLNKSYTWVSVKLLVFPFGVVTLISIAPL